jgi:hypothetical protein
MKCVESVKRLEMLNRYRLATISSLFDGLSP